MQIKQPLSLHGIGKRKNQEDSIYPNVERKTEGFASSEGFGNRLFIVCDGVGGMNKGEVASDLACREFAKSINTVGVAQSHTDSNIQIYLQAFEHTQNAFDKHIAENPETKGMATTLVAVHIHEQGLAVTHCGDSRFYHIRNEKILWQTDDHTVINELIKAGAMTEEEAKDSKRNKISRAIQGNVAQLSKVEKKQKVKPDIHFIKDIQKDDYLFLCSDGVSGSITDTELCDILSTQETNQEKMQTINTLCEANSADNYSAYLIQIDNIKIPKYVIKTKEKSFFTKIKSKFSNFVLK